LWGYSMDHFYFNYMENGEKNLIKVGVPKRFVYEVTQTHLDGVMSNLLHRKGYPINEMFDGDSFQRFAKLYPKEPKVVFELDWADHIYFLRKVK
jgi:hypothetical protein